MRGALSGSAFSPAPASAANTLPSIRQSRSLSRRGSAAGPTSSSTAASGLARQWARAVRSSCSIRHSSIRRSASGLAFLIGATIGLVILVMRLWIPESPRWLVTHGFPQAALAVVRRIEAQFSARGGDAPVYERVRLRMRDHTPLREVARTLFITYSQARLVGLTLMAAQAFF